MIDAPKTAELIARLQKRKEFGLNGQRWMMLNQPDSDCQEAAIILAAQAREIEALIAARPGALRDVEPY